MQNQDAQLYLCECFLVDLHAPPASTNECSSLPKLAFNTDAASIGNFLHLPFGFLVPFQRAAVGTAD